MDLNSIIKNWVSLCTRLVAEAGMRKNVFHTLTSIVCFKRWHWGVTPPGFLVFHQILSQPQNVLHSFTDFLRRSGIQSPPQFFINCIRFQFPSLPWWLAQLLFYLAIYFIRSVYKRPFKPSLYKSINQCWQVPQFGVPGFGFRFLWPGSTWALFQWKPAQKVDHEIISLLLELELEP
jgi:hypothetical protein